MIEPENGIFCGVNLFKTASGKAVLNGVNVFVRRGQVVALLGPNGAGKTTCFSILCGLIKPDSGRILIDQGDVTDLPMYKRARLGVGYLPQEPSIFRGLTVEENILAVLEGRYKDSSLAKQKLNELLQDFSIEHLRKVDAVLLSGGERRRLEIARALANNPKYILLDEPLAGIDPIAIADMRSMISNLKERGIGVIITDHNVRDTLPIADYSYILHDGKVIAEGITQDIIKNEKAVSLYFGSHLKLDNISDL